MTDELDERLSLHKMPDDLARKIEAADRRSEERRDLIKIGLWIAFVLGVAAWTFYRLVRL